MSRWWVMVEIEVKADDIDEAESIASSLLHADERIVSLDVADLDKITVGIDVTGS